MTEHDALTAAVNAAVEKHGYPWVVGVLEGCVRVGWTIEQTAAYLEEHS